MKKINFLLSPVVLSIMIFAYWDGLKDRKEKSVELITTKTLGLAYLEEFKLEKHFF